MRIIAGKYKRKHLKTIESYDTRPTKDMVKEALFSSIFVNNKSFLDLFAGSGAIGIEAISRNASAVVFNDHNIECVKVIQENLNSINENAIVYNLEVFNLIDSLKKQTFDFVYIDPPYKFEKYEELLVKLINNEIVYKDSVIIFEVHKDIEISENIENFKCFKIRKYGITKLLYYQY